MTRDRALIRDGFSQLDVQFAEVRQSFSDIDERLDELDRRFEQVLARLDTLAALIASPSSPPPQSPP